MNRLEPHIRVKLSVQGTGIKKADSERQAFWYSIQQQLSGDFGEKQILELERRLVRGVSKHLQQSLVEAASKPILDASQLFDRTSYEYIDFLRDEFFTRLRREDYESEVMASLTFQLYELRANQLREIPNYEELLERISLASSINITSRIMGYGSLIFGIDFGSIEQLARVFGCSYDDLEVFLDAYIPQAVEDTFQQRDKLPLNYSIQIDSRVSEKFEVSKETFSTIQPPIVTTNEPTERSPLDQRKERIWMIANGSLLFPVILTLIVGYFLLQEGRHISTMQSEAMKPVLDYYQKILTLQNASMNASTNTVVTPQSTIPKPAKKTTP